MRSQHKRKLVSLALAALFSVGFSDCVGAQNPFAGKLPSLPLPKIFSGKLRKPLVKPLAKKLPTLPRPNFGNLARTIRTPAAEAIAARSRQPPAAPSRTFDTSSADQQIAAGKMPSSVKSSLDLARKAAEASRDAIESKQNDFNSAIAGTKPPKSEDLFSKIKTKTKTAQSTSVAAKQAGSNSKSTNVWSNYKPDTRPSSSNVTSGGIAELAKVNPRLYDRYGKLTSSNGSSDGQFVATNAERNFDFQPAKETGAMDKVSSDNSDATIAGLQSQLKELRSRGTGSSDELSVPHRSAFDIAGVVPVKPVVEKPELPVHRGFGDAASLGERQQVVSIPDPTAPPNVLRPIAKPTPGMVATIEIESSFDEAAPKKPAGELPVGSSLSSKLKTSEGSAEKSMVNNDFVGSSKTESPMLRARAIEEVQDMELPRQLSQASLDALDLAKQEKLNQPLPEINKKSGPLVGGLSNPKIASTQFQPQTAPSTQTARQPSASFPGRFVSETQGRQQQVTTNQFFNRAAEPASEPSARVAEAQLLTPTLPEGLTTGNSTYSPGSVRGLEKKLW